MRNRLKNKRDETSTLLLFMAQVMALVIAQISLPAPAEAFVCTRTQSDNKGSSTSWYARDITFVINEKGSATISDTSAVNEFVTLARSFAPWGSVTLPDTTLSFPDAQSADAIAECGFGNERTDLSFHFAGETSASNVGYNFLAPDENENLLLFHDDEWPQEEQQGIVIALTTTTYSTLTGQIFDADIEFNAADFNLTTSQDDVAWDLENTAVHEIGHFLGLAHSDLPAATMYSDANETEILKRTLACDDFNGLLFKYPADNENGYCQPTIDCGLCAPPQQITETATVTASSPKDGLSSCAQSSPLLLLMLCFFLPFRPRYSLPLN